MGYSDLHEKLSCIITPGNMSLLNCEIYQREGVSRVVDTELILLIAHLNSITGFNSWFMDELGAIKHTNANL